MKWKSHRLSNAVPLTRLMLFAVLLMPHVAFAEACPPPKILPVGDQFYFCFDGPRVAPQPIIKPDAGPYLVVEAELNGHKLPALLDTGAGVSVVDSSVAKEIGLKPGGSFEVTAVDGKKTQALKAPIDQFVIGGFIRKSGTVVVTDLSAMRQVAAQPFAMVVGADILSQVAVGVDRDNQSLIVLPANAQANGSEWIAPIRLQQPDNMFMTDISIDGHRVTVRLDSGADDELILRDSAWAQIVPSTARTTTSLGVGAAGFFVKPLVRLADVKIGGESIGDAIATQIASATSTGNSDGILGMGILSHFSFFLNPQTGVLVISRPQKPQPPRLETMAGILGPPTDEGITVMHVMAKSPAEAAGIKEGDRFCTVDGETVHASWHDDPKHAWMTGPDGKTVVLGRCGGGEVKVTLRRFY